MLYRAVYRFLLISFVVMQTNYADLEHVCAHSNQSVEKFRKTLLSLDKKEAVAICLADGITAKKSVNFSWPVDLCNFWISSLFGLRTYKGTTKMHHGIDLASLKGTAVTASADGKVTTSSNDAVGYGSLVEIKHDKGFSTRYGHLDTILVHVGQQVKKGDLIGTVGAKGNVRGKKDPSHLHFEVRHYGQSLNPLKYLYCSEVINFK